MRMKRKAFEHPSGSFQDKKGFLWWGKKDPEDPWIPKTFSEVVKEVEDFITNLGAYFVSVSEYTLSKERRGDDKITRWVVWYWAEEETDGEIIGPGPECSSKE